MSMTRSAAGIRRAARKPVVLIVAAAVLVLGVAAGVTLTLRSQSGSPCQSAFIPAYFYSWTPAVSTSPAPSVMILDITGVGPGNAPVPHFQSLVRQAKAAGVTVLGYSSTAYGTRPAAQIEADVRNYKAWYGVTGIFLDSVNGVSSELPYYRQLSSYIHHVNPGSAVWLNPGDNLDRQYMSVGNVVMNFEGTYAQYVAHHVPAWVSRYPASRFANTIYASSPSQLSNAIRLSRTRNAGYVYVTNLSGSNPYSALPSYWNRELAAIYSSSGCGSGSGQAAAGS
ncbi:MAG: spherulation-specific family 4 protein [Streptosporangiaceae bacterium]|jgi:hypothetical protein